MLALIYQIIPAPWIRHGWHDDWNNMKQATEGIPDAWGYITEPEKKEIAPVAALASSSSTPPRVQCQFHCHCYNML